MVKHYEIYSLIYQTLVKTINSQIPKPKSADLDILLNKLYKNTPSNILALEENIINDLGGNPQLLNEALTLLRCCVFLTVIEEGSRTLEDAYKLIDIIQLLQSRDDIHIESVCASLESVVVRDISIVDNLKDLLK